MGASSGNSAVGESLASRQIPREVHRPHVPHVEIRIREPVVQFQVEIGIFFDQLRRSARFLRPIVRRHQGVHLRKAFFNALGQQHTAGLVLVFTRPVAWVAGNEEDFGFGAGFRGLSASAPSPARYQGKPPKLVQGCPSRPGAQCLSPRHRYAPRPPTSCGATGWNNHPATRRAEPLRTRRALAATTARVSVAFR